MSEVIKNTPVMHKAFNKEIELPIFNDTNAVSAKINPKKITDEKMVNEIMASFFCFFLFFYSLHFYFFFLKKKIELFGKIGETKTC
jgi:hypothetical protein